jgi:hypothetical protein
MIVVTLPKGRRTRMKKFLLIVALSLFLAGCGEALPSEVTPSPTATFTPFPTPIPTAIVPTQPPNVPAVLGNPIKAFFDRFGQPNDQSTLAFFTWDSVQGTGDHLVAYTDDVLPLERVNSMILTATHNAVWTEQDALTHCASYFPVDAKRGMRYELINNDPNIDPSLRHAGYTVVYTSTSLGKDFPASDFTDDKGNEVQPGTFDVQYIYSGPNGPNPDNCNIALGSQNLTE